VELSLGRHGGGCCAATPLMVLSVDAQQGILCRPQAWIGGQCPRRHEAGALVADMPADAAVGRSLRRTLTGAGCSVLSVISPSPSVCRLVAVGDSQSR
jgi:hypothetical protein